MAVAAVDRTDSQRMHALTRGNEVRSYRADMKRRMKSGEVDVAAIVAGEVRDWRLESWKVGEFLLACPQFGRVRVQKVLGFAGVSPSRSLGALTGRQRSGLVGALRGQPPARRFLR